MSNEVELKFLIAPDDVERFLHHPVFQTVARHELLPQQLVSVYYDTPAFDLRKNRIALRLRRMGDRWIQTVKTEGKVAGGLHERPEWECETAENRLDFDAIPNPTVREFFADEKIRWALRSVFVTEFTRTSSLLEFPWGEMVECSLDQGEIRAGEQRVPLCEVELELKTGHPARLFELALGLQEGIPLKLENVSKAERGYQLITPTALVPSKAQTPELTGESSPSKVLVCILRSGMTHLQANEAGVVQGEDPEFLHQMRVALRRIRSALSIFSDYVQHAESEPLKEELRWLTRELDAARNWDVFVLETLPPILAAFPEHQGLSWLKTTGEEWRHQQNLRAHNAVASDRYQRMLLRLGAWLCRQPWREDAKNGEGVIEKGVIPFVSRILQKRHRRLKKKGKLLVTLSPGQRHEVRIAAKKMRYAAEFFSSLYPHKRTRRYIAALAVLQEVLGALNDAATTVSLLRGPEVSTDEPIREQTKSLVLGWSGGVGQTRLKDLEAAWENFVDQKAFW
jgi:triphosphatase